MLLVLSQWYTVQHLLLNKCWTRVGHVERLLRLVEYSFNFRWSNMCAFWRELRNGGRRSLIMALRCKRCRCNYETPKKRTKKSENVDSRMAKKQDLFRGILHSLGRAQKPILTHSQSSITIQSLSFSRHVGSFHQAAWHQTRKRLVDVVQQAITCWKE